MHMHREQGQARVKIHLPQLSGLILNRKSNTHLKAVSGRSPIPISRAQRNTEEYRGIHNNTGTVGG